MDADATLQLQQSCPDFSALPRNSVRFCAN